jgi:hypothetical protein
MDSVGNESLSQIKSLARLSRLRSATDGDGEIFPIFKAVDIQKSAVNQFFEVNRLIDSL